MSRIRSVHPSLWTDDGFMALSPWARLLVMGLWNECDDGGAFEWKPRQLKVRLLGADDLDIAALLGELQRDNWIGLYRVDGRQFGVVRAFGRFQHPKKPARTLPMPHRWRVYAATEHLAGDDVEEDAEPPVPCQLPEDPPVP